MSDMEEFEIREGEGTEFAATLIITPVEDEDGDTVWAGKILFDNPDFNWEDRFAEHQDSLSAETKKLAERLCAWDYGSTKSSGTHMMNLLMTWHEDIVNLFGRVRAKAGRVAGEGATR